MNWPNALARLTLLTVGLVIILNIPMSPAWHVRLTTIWAFGILIVGRDRNV